MGKTTEGIKISLNGLQKEAIKECFQQKNFEIKIFILKFAKNTIFYTKIDIWAPNCE